MSFKPEIIGHVTLPQLKLEIGKTAYVKVTGEIFKGKEIVGRTKEGEKQKPADLMNVINLETGEACQMVVPAVVKSVFEEDLDGEYVGRGFAITKGDKPEGKRYFTYKIDEVKV